MDNFSGSKQHPITLHSLDKINHKKTFEQYTWFPKNKYLAHYLSVLTLSVIQDVFEFVVLNIFFLTDWL